ncbi:MAG TPA: cytochrome c biogenesis protein CcsA [Steroidobacter sp.]
MLSILVLACYLASAAWVGSSVYRAEEHAAHGRRAAGLGLGFLAIVLHAVLLWRGLFVRDVITFNAAETASLIGLPIAVIAFVAAWVRPRFAGIAAALMVIAGLTAASMVDGSGGYALERPGWETAAHIALSTLAYALLTIAVALAVALRLLDRRLRKRQPLGWLKILPSVEALEAGTFHALAAGFAVLTLSLFSGFIFVEDLLAQHLWHKTVLSCLAWVVFGVVLFGRWRFGWRGRTATTWTLSGFALLALAYFGSKLVLEALLGRHWG